MARRALADVYYEDADEDKSETGTWLLLYDFRGKKPSARFWENLSRLRARGLGAHLIQYSALWTASKRIAYAAKKLSEHYGAETRLFSATQADS